MLTQSYLFNHSGTDQLLGNKATGFLHVRLCNLRLVLPREYCVYARVSCKDVPLLSVKGFALLQIEQLSPFQSYGAYVAKQQQMLHIWMWDKVVERSFSDKHGKAPRYIVPDSLLGLPQLQGVNWFKKLLGNSVEAQLWKNSYCIDTLHFDKMPSPLEWAQHIAGQSHLTILGWPSSISKETPKQSDFATLKPWGRNVLSPSFSFPQIKFAPLLQISLWLATAALAAATASWLSEAYAHKKAIAEGLEAQKDRLTKIEPLEQARSSTQNIEQWLVSVRSLSPTPTKLDILNMIASLVSRQGLVVRELDFSPPTLSAVFVPARSGDIRLTAIIGAIEANALFYDARFVDVVGGNAYKFTWRVKDIAKAKSNETQGVGVRQ
jgi:hypothetical protein